MTVPSPDTSAFPKDLVEAPSTLPTRSTEDLSQLPDTSPDPALPQSTPSLAQPAPKAPAHDPAVTPYAPTVPPTAPVNQPYRPQPSPSFPPQQPYASPQFSQPYGGHPFNIVINNASTANASATGINYALPRKRQSLMVHFLLFIFTMGIGNIIYWWMVTSENRRRGY